MSQITQFFFPPQYWQQFEDLTQAVFPHVFGDPAPSKIGRPGQSQKGVDVHGISSNNGDPVGIQCKRMDDLDENNEPYPGGPITKKILLSEYEQACTFRPELKFWILATTAKRNARIQESARELDEKSRRRNLFAVKLWFWEDYVTFLNCFDDVVARYYPVIMNLRSPLDQDKVILELFTLALSRPAFNTPFQHEQADDFEKALRDSHTPIEIGELVNRETRHVIRKAVGGWRSIKDPQWREGCKDVSAKLHSLRSRIRDGLKDGTITRTSGNGIRVANSSIERDLLQLRRDYVCDMNKILSAANLPTI